MAYEGNRTITLLEASQCSGSYQISSRDKARSLGPLLLPFFTEVERKTPGIGAAEDVTNKHKLVTQSFFFKNIYHFKRLAPSNKCLHAAVSSTAQARTITIRL